MVRNMERIRAFLEEKKSSIIVAIVIWIFLLFLVGCPLTMAIVQAGKAGESSIVGLVEGFIQWFSKPMDSLAGSFLHFGLFMSTGAKLTAIYFIVMLVAIINSKSNTGEDYTNIEHGSSDWCEGGEQYKILSPKKGILLAEKNYLPVDKRGNVNVLVIGGSGAGKSASFVIPNAYQLLGSYVFTDPKGELYDKVAGYLKANGYEIKIFNLLNPKNSDGYNPLHHIRSEIDVDVIANTIIRGQAESSTSSEPYWDDMSEMLLKALIYYLMATRPPEEQNLASCSELVRAANNNGGDNLLTNLISQLPYDHPARMYYKSVELASDKTYSSILSSLQSKLGKFDSKEIAELTSTNTIDFEEIGKKKTAVFVMSSDTHAAYDFLLTIFFSQMIQQLYDFADKEGGALKVPTYFILDEFANIGRIPDFDKKISTSRSRKISFSVIVQNLDQLEAIYKDSYETILGNCDTHLFLGSNSQKTVEYFSKALGEKTIIKDSVSISRDKNRQKQGYSTSDQSLARALMTPDEMRRMDNDLCIIFEKGIKPVKARKYYYFEHPSVKYAQQYPADHNNVVCGLKRGTWRKYNPYNPYVEEEKEADVQIGSLDDLFDETPAKEEVKEKQPVKAKKQETEMGLASLDELEESTEQPTQKSKPKEIDPFEDLMAPTLPQDDETGSQPEVEVSPEKEEETEMDIQKELEKKFDELFGSIDGNVENHS